MTEAERMAIAQLAAQIYASSLTLRRWPESTELALFDSYDRARVAEASFEAAEEFFKVARRWREP